MVTLSLDLGDLQLRIYARRRRWCQCDAVLVAFVRTTGPSELSIRLSYAPAPPLPRSLPAILFLLVVAKWWKERYCGEGGSLRFCC